METGQIAIDVLQEPSPFQFSEAVPVGSSHALAVTETVSIHCHLEAELPSREESFPDRNGTLPSPSFLS